MTTHIEVLIEVAPAGQWIGDVRLHELAADGFTLHCFGEAKDFSMAGQEPRMRYVFYKATQSEDSG